MIRVLVVDDSALVREMMTRTLGASGRFEIAVAADPIIAMQKMARSRPHVMLLDITMPRMDGLSFLRQLMRDDPLPVVVCSALAGDATETAVRALREGAVDVVPKPRLDVRGFLEQSGERIADVLVAAAAADVGRLRSTPPPHEPFPRTASSAALIAIGASTGGTEALHAILEAMPHDAPPIAIVQHMPEGFTAAFARHLDRTTHLRVKEAAHGDTLVRGRALVAPGNHHMIVRGDRVEIASSAPVSRHRPSVDVLFDSVARTAGRDAVGVILTGMGDDGAAGLLAMKRAGARTIAQDRATSVVFGMAREAVARGAVDESDVIPLGSIAARILQPNKAGKS
jgi:two-component system chemotaxis response regulator CheB